MIERKLSVNLVNGALAWAVGLIAIPLTAVPFLAYAHYSQEGRMIALHVDRSFRGPAYAPLGGAELRYFRDRHLHYSNAVIVLNVHAVMDGGGGEAPNPESSVLPVRLFGDDMQMLHDAGYHAVTPEQITAWREGVLDLPHDALLLTFDDGRTDTVLNAPRPPYSSTRTPAAPASIAAGATSAWPDLRCTRHRPTACARCSARAGRSRPTPPRPSQA